MAHSLVARNDMVNWAVGPAEHEIANYDEPKIRYRRYVEQYIKAISSKSLRKKPFFTISTNVLCADIRTSKDTIDPIDRDIYLPLEIAITKWSLMDSKEPIETRSLTSKVWFINPGRPTPGSVSQSMEHRKLHKIEFDTTQDSENQFCETDLSKVLKEINSFLTVDRIVFSLGLKYVRQDLGCLKWLNRETGYKFKPIKIYSLEDLYVALIRHLEPSSDSFIGLGIARHRLEITSDTYNLKFQCQYHQARTKEIEGGECRFCAKCLTITYTSVLLDDVVNFTDLFGETIQSISPSKSDTEVEKEDQPSFNEGH